MIAQTGVFCWTSLSLRDSVSCILCGLAKEVESERDSVTLHFMPEFRANSQPSDLPHGPIGVLRFTSILNEDDGDLLFCAWFASSRSINLSRTAPHGMVQRRLFVNLNPKVP